MGALQNLRTPAQEAVQADTDQSAYFLVCAADPKMIVCRGSCRLSLRLNCGHAKETFSPGDISHYGKEH